MSGTAAKKPVKQPADRKPKEEDRRDEPKSIEVALRGETWTISADAVDDFELLDDLNEIDTNGNAARMPSLLRRLLGPGQYRAALDLIRDDNGRVTVEAGQKFVMDMFKEIDPNS